MKNGKMTKEIIAQVVAALLIQIILYGVVYIWSSFNKEKLNITICSSTKSNNGYTTSINIKNYQNDKSINSITIWSNTNIDPNSLNYKDIESYNDKIVLKNIPPAYNGTIIAYSQDKINEENTKFETEEKRIVKFLDTQKEEIASYWNQMILNIVIYIIIYTIMVVITNLITKKQIEKYNQTVEQLNKEHEEIKEECKNLKAELEKREKENKEINKIYLKIKIYLHRKLIDYAKELEFYKNLIKNIVNKDNIEDDICYKITKELKTFKTLEKIKLEDLEIDSIKLSDIKDDEIKKSIEE